jgi:DNA-binding GntR family transcriptional regulator
MEYVRAGAHGCPRACSTAARTSRTMPGKSHAHMRKSSLSPDTTASLGAAAPGRGQISRPSGLVENVYARIRGDIMSLKIPPNSRISVDSLVRELGVSQTPIREALSMLEGSGLVTKERFIGYCAAPTLNRKQFEDLYEIRLLVEPYGARRAAQKMQDRELTAVSELAQQMSAARAKESREGYDLFAEQDAEFHARIARGSGNELIVESLSRLHTHLHIFRLRFHPEATKEAYAEHALITRALQRRKPKEAEAAMRSHIEKSYERLVKFTTE